MFWKFTNWCNSRCVTCDIWNGEPTTLDIETASRIDRFVDPVNVKEIYFTGGEPFLPENCVDHAIMLSKWKPGVALTGASNSLDPELYLPRIAKIAEAGVWLNVMVSLNGRPETHDWSRGCPGNYNAALRFAEGLKLLGVLCTFNLLEFPGVTTQADRDHVKAVADRFGVFMSLSPILRHMPWFNQPDDGATIPIFNCHAIRGVICVHPNGDITACQEPRPALELANLKDEGLDEAHVNDALAIIDSKGCQPCGCCTVAYTRGLRCVTGGG